MWTLARIRCGQCPHICGVLAYMTCSLLEAENGDQIAAYLARAPHYRLDRERRFGPLDGGDGFYLACLRRL